MIINLSPEAAQRFAAAIVEQNILAAQGIVFTFENTPDSTIGRNEAYQVADAIVLLKEVLSGQVRMGEGR